MAETNCPRCNPEAKPRIRRLNKTSICLICMNTGWTEYDKKCKICGENSGIDLTCYSCYEKITTESLDKIKITSRYVPINKNEIQRSTN